MSFNFCRDMSQTYFTHTIVFLFVNKSTRVKLSNLNLVKMPPKSNKKEDKKALWIYCDECGFKITQKQLESKKECDGYGIRRSEFFTDGILSNVPKKLNDIQSSYLERFILIPHDIAILCCLTMNCELIIELNETRKYVRKAWVVDNDREVDKVYSTSKGM